MVNKIISYLGREINGLHEAAYLLGLFAIFSQILALLRDRLLAHSFGASVTLDLYYAAFRIPDFIFAIVASLFSASILIPFLSEKIKFDQQAGREFFSAMFSVFLVVMILVCGLTFFFVPWLIPKLFPGFALEPIKSEAVLLTRILLLSPIFLGLSNLFASVTQLYNRFFIYAISPLLYNIGIIVGIIFFAPIIGSVGLVWGVVLGAVMHLLVQVPFVLSQGFLPKLVLSVSKYRLTTSALVVAMPRTLALSAQEISRFFLIALASLMGVGSISVFSFSFNLQSVPLSIIGVSYSLAAFPTLASLFSSGDGKRYVELIQTTARHIIFFSVPIIALFLVLRAHIVRVVLGSGAFDWQDTRLTAAATALFVVSLVAQGLILLFTRARYASGDTKTPFYINIFSVIVTIVGASIFSRLFSAIPEFRFFIEAVFRVSDVPGTVVLMLPLAFSVGSLLAMLAHLFAFERDYPGTLKILKRTTIQIFVVSVISGLVAYLGLNLAARFVGLETFVGVLTQGVIAGVLGLICGIILLVLSKNREFGEVSKMLVNRLSKLWRTPVVGPDPGVV